MIICLSARANRMFRADITVYLEFKRTKQSSLYLPLTIPLQGPEPKQAKHCCSTRSSFTTENAGRLPARWWKCHPGHWEVFYIFTEEAIRRSAFVSTPHQRLFEVLDPCHCFVEGTGGTWESSDGMLPLKDKQNAFKRGPGTLGWHRDECQGTTTLCEAILPSRTKGKCSVRSARP